MFTFSSTNRLGYLSRLLTWYGSPRLRTYSSNLIYGDRCTKIRHVNHGTPADGPQRVTRTAKNLRPRLRRREPATGCPRQRVRPRRGLLMRSTPAPLNTEMNVLECNCVQYEINCVPPTASSIVTREVSQRRVTTWPALWMIVSRGQKFRPSLGAAVQPPAGVLYRR